MAIVWNHCKSKMICEADEQRDDGDLEGDEPKKGHGGCGHVQPLIRKEGLKLFLQYKKPKDEDEVWARHARLHRMLTVFQDIKTFNQDKRLFTPSEVYATLMKISDPDLHLLGLSDEYARPEWMILTVLPVPPPPVRPSIAVDGGTMRSEDDLTYKLGEIIKASTNVRKSEQEGSPAHIVTEYEQLLQVRVIEYTFGRSLFLNIFQFHVATYMDND